MTKFRKGYLICLLFFWLFANIAYSQIDEIIGVHISADYPPPPSGEPTFTYIYAGGVGGALAKVRLSDLTTVSTVSLSHAVYMGDVDLVNRKILLAGSQVEYFSVVDIDTMTRDREIDLGPLLPYDFWIRSIIVDPYNSGICFIAAYWKSGPLTPRGFVAKVNYLTGNLIAYQTLVSGTTIAFQLGEYYNGWIDSNYVYFADNNNPPLIWRISKSNLANYNYISTNEPNQQGVTSFKSQELSLNLIYAMLMSRYGYYNTIDRIDTSTFTKTGQLNLTSGINLDIGWLYVDTDNRYLYGWTRYIYLNKMYMFKIDLVTFTLLLNVETPDLGGTARHVGLFDKTRNRIYASHQGGFKIYSPSDLSKISDGWTSTVGTITFMWND